MSRLQIKNIEFDINDDIVKPYFQNPRVTHTNLTSTQTRLNQKPNKSETDLYVLKWINNQLEQKSNEVYNRNENKRAVSDENPHKNTHNKNNGAKPSDLTGSVYNSMMNESLNTEISEIKYLIEYLTNNNKNNI
jgi:hypothetical protein